jgi:hypothetical protein
MRAARGDATRKGTTRDAIYRRRTICAMVAVVARA